MTTMPDYSFECPECGRRIFERSTNLFADGETEMCPGCGEKCMVSVCYEDTYVVRCDDDNQ